MRKLTLTAVVGTLVAVSASACGGSANTATSPQNGHCSVQAPSGLVKDGTLVFGTSWTLPPQDFQQNGKPTGSDIEIASALAEQMSLKPKFRTSVDRAKASRRSMVAADMAISSAAVSSSMSNSRADPAPVPARPGSGPAAYPRAHSPPPSTSPVPLKPSRRTSAVSGPGLHHPGRQRRLQRPAGKVPIESGHRAHRIQDRRLHRPRPRAVTHRLRLRDRPATRHRQLHRPR